MTDPPGTAGADSAPVELGKRDADKLDRMASAFDRLDGTLRDLCRQGLQRLSRPAVGQLQAAELVAHHAGLVKVERELAALQTLATRYLDRDPLFRAAEWLGAINTAHEHVAAAKAAWRPGIHPDALAGVTGVARRSYEPVDRPLEVVAIGASGWVTDSDFVGVTVWLRESATGALFQASVVRPVAYFGDDPRRLLYGEISDHHALTLLDLAHGGWVLDGARASTDGRLSLHRELRLEPAPWTGAAAYADRFAPDWLSLVERLRGDEVEGRDLVYVEPRDVSRVVIDEKQSVARFRLSDANGAWLVAHVRLAKHANALVDDLMQLTSDPALRPDGWFGRAWVAAGELRFLPHTALYREPRLLELRGKREVFALHLGLEPARALRTP